MYDAPREQGQGRQSWGEAAHSAHPQLGCDISWSHGLSAAQNTALQSTVCFAFRIKKRDPNDVISDRADGIKSEVYTTYRVST